MMAEKFLNLVKDINLQNQEVSKCQIGETKENQAHADHNRTPENQRYRKKKLKQPEKNNTWHIGETILK